MNQPQQVNLQIEKFFTKDSKLTTFVQYFELNGGNLGLELNVGELKVIKTTTSKLPVPQGMTRFIAELPLTVKVKADQLPIFEVFVLEAVSFVASFEEVPTGFDVISFANFLAPYASSALRDLVGKSGYPQIDMPPLVFNRQPTPTPTVPDYNAAWKH